MAGLATHCPTQRCPRHFFGQYQVHLIDHGLTESAATQRLNSIRRMMRTNTDGWALMFDNIYANPTPGFQTLPNRLLVNAVAGITAGRALDIGAGQGCKALFLGQAGWDVTAIDVSEVGLQVAAHNAQEAGVQLRTACQNWQRKPFHRLMLAV